MNYKFELTYIDSGRGLGFRKHYKNNFQDLCIRCNCKIFIPEMTDGMIEDYCEECGHLSKEHGITNHKLG